MRQYYKTNRALRMLPFVVSPFNCRHFIQVFCIVFLIIPAFASGQGVIDTGKNKSTLTRVNGAVVDATTKKPLPFISVRFTGSNYGVHSDENGRFQLSANGLFKTISVSFVGYKSVTRSITPGEINTVSINMQSSSTQMKEVVVTSGKKNRYRNKGNPAVELIRQIIDHKNQNRMQSSDYLQYKQYERIGLSLFNLSEKFINGGFFKKYQFMLDSTQEINDKVQTSLPVYFGEKVKQYFYRKQPEKAITILDAHREANVVTFVDTAGLNIYINRLYGDNIDLYSNNIFIVTNQFLSPIADHAPDFYKFFITDTLKLPTGNLVEVRFTPRNKGDLLFEGKLLVTLDGNYAVTSCTLELNKQINLNFLRSLKTKLDFKKYPDGRYYLAKTNVKSDFGIFRDKGAGMFGERTVFYSNYKLNAPQPPDFYKGKSQQSAAESNSMSESFWTNNRPDTLPQKQAEIYSRFDRLKAMSSYRTTSAIASTITGSFYDFGPFQLGPYGNIYSHDYVEGTRLSIGGRTTPGFNKSIYLTGHIAYGFKDQQAKYYLGTTYAFNQTPYWRFPNDYLRVSYEYETDVPGQNFLVDKTKGFLAIFSRGRSDLWLYNRIFQVNYVKDLESHFSYNLEFKRWNQHPAGGLTYEANDHPGVDIDNLKTTEINLALRYAPHEQILQGTSQRRTIYSKYPIFNLQINHGVKGLFDGSYNYTNVSSTIFKRFYMSQLGFSDITLQAGYLFGQVPFPFLQILPANQTYIYSDDLYNSMNYLEFVSDHYAGFNLTHSFNGFFLNKIPLIEHLKWREYLSFKLLYGGLRNENNPLYSAGLYKFPLNLNGTPETYALGNVPYMEAGVGVGNIFKFIRIDLIRRFNYLDHPGVSAYGFRFSFSPDL